MEPKVFPISITNLDWQMLLHAAKVTFGKDVARPLDEAGIKLEGLKAQLMCYGNILGLNSKLDDYVRDTEDLLKHIHLTVLVDINPSDLLGILTLCKVRISYNYTGEVGIMTGSMKDWRELCLILDENNSTKNHRIFSNQITMIVNSLGLTDIWFNYNRRTLADGTFLLEHKS